MIDVASETLILPTEVPKVLPRQKGKKINLSTIYRWMQLGLCGVKLEYVCIGGTRFTRKQALNRFFSRITAVKTGDAIDRRVEKNVRQKQADSELDAAGI
ncbi:MAG: DUF1580 domain-containing protein [Pirellulaceae bacterium]|nr:DUF1580 domain-containing protein [Pirellulaceae bacterium]